MKRVYLVLIAMLVIESNIQAATAGDENLIAHNHDRSVRIYSAAPADFNPKLEVSACYSRFDGKYLLLHRSNDIKDLPGIWGVPGGKVQVKTGETEEQANAREFEEETGIKLPLEAFKFFRTVWITDPHKNFVFHMFTHEFSEEPEVRLSAAEHQAFAWLSFEEAIKLALIPGEVECLELLQPIKTESK